MPVLQNIIPTFMDTTCDECEITYPAIVENEDFSFIEIKNNI